MSLCILDFDEFIVVYMCWHWWTPRHVSCTRYLQYIQEFLPIFVVFTISPPLPDPFGIIRSGTVAELNMVPPGPENCGSIVKANIYCNTLLRMLRGVDLLC
jgi:hypothetical protein